jgi:senataxin
MVGDPNQLPPTVLSQMGQKFQYEQSLFQRIMKNIPDAVHLLRLVCVYLRIALMSLSIQYRMHPDISQLPSVMFYDSKLEDGPELDVKRTADWHRDSLLSPYKFFDVHSGKEVRKTGGRSVFNPEEIDACVKLVERICSSHPQLNVDNFNFGPLLIFYSLPIESGSLLHISFKLRSLRNGLLSVLARKSWK